MSSGIVFQAKKARRQMLKYTLIDCERGFARKVTKEMRYRAIRHQSFKFN